MFAVALMIPRPDSWGKAWSLHRRQTGTDSYGDPKTYYDMDTPDYEAEAGTNGAVAWQSTEGGEQVQEPGEISSGSATGRIFDSTIEVSEFDRVVFDGAVWEIRSIDYWPSFRSLKVVKMD